ncbi:trans-sulfuration enzyme family protein [Qipengyuania spongiae]|uniref:PLP-dependent aspartate aminotransferase family protein n=1 Tax=Qipengyuania spongiae TaxID=2909673 RepID=A0ABY5SZ83_9SPHN|nr:PLP-dependent aspartate aminotransferase family protein [Qipengyuania spongiae]UVI39569.1 PLP-dependent aspartate aminotransferase family protein [Qipengyuania spongiae]
MIEFDPLDIQICLRAGDDVAEHGGAVLPPIAQASLFRKATMEELHRDLAREHIVSTYSRGTNPTVKALERTLAKLERAEACKCFASGMGAIGALLFGLLKAGDRVLFVGDIYGPTLELARRLEDFGILHDQTFAGDVAAIAPLLREETRLIYVESPGSMLFGVADLPGIAALARERSILTALDNTVATPLLQKPMELGIDFVIHSCTKYIGGHSDALGGALLGPAERIERIFYDAYMLLGAVMAPFDAFLFLRGLMSLPVRLRQHHADALTVARYLAGHSAVSRVFHPQLGLEATMPRNWRGHSGLFSFELADGSLARAMAVANHLKLFGKAVSWGGAESLVITGHKREPASEVPPRIPAGLLRLSIGLEGADALVADLEQALA